MRFAAVAFALAAAVIAQDTTSTTAALPSK